MARAIPVAAGAGDVQAIASAVTLLGYSVREAGAPAAVATVILRDGTSVADPVRVLVELAGDASETQVLPAVEFATGVFVDRSGDSELVLYVL